MFLKSISLVLALLMLPSCSTGLLGITASPNLNFGTDLATPGLAMVQRVDALPITPSSAMPNGTYTYNGFAGFGAGSVSSLSELTRIAKMTMAANFQTNTFSGSMTKLTNETYNATYDGTINMSGSISGNTFNGVHSGVWRMNSTNGYVQRPYNGTVSGVFGGSGAIGMAGTTNSTFAGTSVTGIIVGER
jgi:hypothetical protein